VVLRPVGAPWTRRAKPVVRELMIMLVLYALWRMVADLTLLPLDGALRRGDDIWRFERTLHLPNELSLQRAAMHLTPLVQFANAYYIVAHVAPLGVFLVWLFFRHRDHYVPWRNVLVFVSLTCLVIQFLPVAPPRMYPQLGFVDTGALYGPRVYDDMGLVAGQVAAMPSMHVAWAVLIGVAVVLVSTSRWRWLALAHPFLTVFAVTVTADHWLLDGIVAGVLLAGGMALVVVLAKARGRPSRLAAVRKPVDDETDLETAPVGG
jgi:hypothetical protein